MIPLLLSLDQLAWNQSSGQGSDPSYSVLEFLKLQNYSLSQNCWDTLRPFCPPNIGV